MRGWMMVAALLVGLAQGSGASEAAAVDALPQRSERTGASHQDADQPLERERERSQDQGQEERQEQNRSAPPRRILADPATSSSSTSAPAQPVFIISCNASGCNDNQGNFLTRSGPQRLVGPKGISCQLMGGNWQCSPGSLP
ncbi:hypothetical protein [Comamonas sp. JUb58]|uniref:hypothetical protein n=1 Tax=Comamonas sp. JUb58 TaxID=2485114 RepID=UPI00105B9F4D|nr:hypothetical protein [Comamonas sp. JUb58]TDS83673.1 hypothetical protein EDF71_104219 [Comamonas sp. JUb58]